MTLRFICGKECGGRSWRFTGGGMCSCFNYAGENVHCEIHGIEPAPEGVVQVRQASDPKP